MDRAQAAIKAGYRVSVVTRRRDAAKHLESLGIEFVNIEFARRGLNPFAEIATIIKLRSILTKLRPDIIHNIALKPVVLGSIAAQLTRFRNVVNAPVGMGYVFTSDEKQALFLRPLVKVLIRYVLSRQNSRVIIENNDDLDNLVTGKFAKRTSIALIKGAGVDLTKFQPTQEPPTPINVIMVSRMLRDKGVNEYVEAARLISKNDKTTNFVLVGDVDDGNPTSITHKQLNEWNQESNVKWLGTRTDIATLFSNSHIACLPSYREGLPKSLIEAAASGLPIVTTDVPGCREIVTEGVNGFLVPARDSEQLAMAIQKLIQNPILRLEMGANNRQKQNLSLLMKS